MGQQCPHGTAGCIAGDSRGVGVAMRVSIALASESRGERVSEEGGVRRQVPLSASGLPAGRPALREGQSRRSARWPRPTTQSASLRDLPAREIATPRFAQAKDAFKLRLHEGIAGKEAGLDAAAQAVVAHDRFERPRVVFAARLVHERLEEVDGLLNQLEDGAAMQ